MNFKRCSTVAALLMTSVLPAFAQEVTTEGQVAATGMEIPAGTIIPEEHILLQFADMEAEGFFVISFDDAAEICGIDDDAFKEIAENPSTGVIYCEELADPVLRQTFIEEGRIFPLTDFEDSDDDDDDGDFADDEEETAVDEANDRDGDGIFDEDDDDMDEDDGLIDNDDADPNDDDMDSGDDMGNDDMGGNDDANGSPDSSSDDS